MVSPICNSPRRLKALYASLCTVRKLVLCPKRNMVLLSSNPPDVGYLTTPESNALSSTTISRLSGFTTGVSTPIFSITILSGNMRSRTLKESGTTSDVPLDIATVVVATTEFCNGTLDTTTNSRRLKSVNSAGIIPKRDMIRKLGTNTAAHNPANFKNCIEVYEDYCTLYI